MLDLSISSIDFIWVYATACRLNQVPFASNRVLQTYRPPYTLASICAAAGEQGVEIRQKMVSYNQLLSLPLPFAVTLLPDVPAGTAGTNNGDGDVTARNYRTALLHRIDDRYVYFTDASHMNPSSMRREELRQRFAGVALLLTGNAAFAARYGQSELEEGGAAKDVADSGETAGADAPPRKFPWLGLLWR